MEILLWGIGFLIVADLIWGSIKVFRINKRRRRKQEEITKAEDNFYAARIAFLTKNGTPSAKKAIHLMGSFIEKLEGSFAKIINNYGDIIIEYREPVEAFSKKFKTHSAKVKDIYFIMSSIEDRLRVEEFSDSVGNRRSEITNRLFGWNDKYFVGGPGEAERLSQFRDEAYKNIFESLGTKLSEDEKNIIKNTIQVDVRLSIQLLELFSEVRSVDGEQNLKIAQSLYAILHNLLDSNSRKQVYNLIVRYGLVMWLEASKEGAAYSASQINNYLHRYVNVDFDKNDIVDEFISIKPSFQDMDNLFMELRAIY